RSFSAFGSSKASTIAIVSPAPAVDEVGKLYTFLTVCGESPVGEVLASGLPWASVPTIAWQCAAPDSGPGQTARALALTFAPCAARTAVRDAATATPPQTASKRPLM